MTDHGMLCKSPFGYMAYQYKSLFKVGGKTTNQIYSGEKNVGKKLRGQCCNREEMWEIGSYTSTILIWCIY